MFSVSTRTWVLVLTSVSSLMIGLDVLVVSTALSTIRVDLNTSVAQLDWVVNAYNLTFAVLLMTGAAFGDRFGRRRIFAAGIMIFTVGSAAGALAMGADWLIASRAFQGAGAAMISPLAMALISAAYPPERRGWALGISGGVTGLATLAGPIIGGAIAGGFGWQWIFWINVPIGLISLPFVFRVIPESYGADTRFDFVGLGLVTGAALGLVWGLMRGSDTDWQSVEVVCALVTGTILALGFVWWESRTREPMLPLRFFASRAFASGNAAAFLLFGSMFSAVFLLGQFLQTALGYEPLRAGLRLLPWTGTLFVVAPIAGSLTDRFGPRPVMVAGLSLQSIGMAWLALIAAPDVTYSAMVVPLLIAGFGPSMVFPAVGSSVIGAVGANEIGKASGVSSMIRELGGVCGIAIAAVVFASAGGYGSAQAFTDGFVPAIGVSAGLAAAGGLVAAMSPGRKRLTLVVAA